MPNKVTKNDTEMGDIKRDTAYWIIAYVDSKMIKVHRLIPNSRLILEEAKVEGNKQ